MGILDAAVLSFLDAGGDGGVFPQHPHAHGHGPWRRSAQRWVGADGHPWCGRYERSILVLLLSQETLWRRQGYPPTPTSLAAKGHHRFGRRNVRARKRHPDAEPCPVACWYVLRSDMHTQHGACWTMTMYLGTGGTSDSPHSPKPSAWAFSPKRIQFLE